MESSARDPADLLTDVVPRLYRVLRAALDDDATLPSLEQLRVMTRIVEGLHHPSALARAREMRMSAITPIIDALVAQAWVTRTPDPADRRRTVLELTRTGKAALNAGRRRTRERLNEVLAHGEAGPAQPAVKDVAAWLEDAVRRYDGQRLGTAAHPETLPPSGRAPAPPRRTERR